MHSAWLLALAVLLPAVHAASEGTPEPGIVNPIDVSTPTTLYVHLLDQHSDSPINSQLPDDRFIESASPFYVSPTTNCLSPVEGGLLDSDWNTWFGFSSAAYVWYDGARDGNPMYHPERSLQWDIRPDLTAPFRLHWFLRTDAPSNALSPVAPGASVILPNMAVGAWMRTSELIGVGNDGYKAGKLLAQGETVGNLGGEQLTSTASPGGSIIWHDVVDAQGVHQSVYEFILEMAWEPDALIPKEQGFGLQVAAYLKSEACDDPANAGITPSLVAPYAGGKLQPRLELAIFDPLRIQLLQPIVVGDLLVIRATVSSALGAYDVNEAVTDERGLVGGISMSVEGPSQASSLQRGEVYMGHAYNTWGHHHDPVDIWYTWNLTEDAASDGAYTVRMAATNDQATATATSTAMFTLGDSVRVTGCVDDAVNGTVVCREQLATPDGDLVDVPAKQAPGPALAAVASLLVAVLVARRRA